MYDCEIAGNPPRKISPARSMSWTLASMAASSIMVACVRAAAECSLASHGATMLVQPGQSLNLAISGELILI